MKYTQILAISIQSQIAPWHGWITRGRIVRRSLSQPCWRGQAELRPYVGTRAAFGTVNTSRGSVQCPFVLDIVQSSVGRGAQISHYCHYRIVPCRTERERGHGGFPVISCGEFLDQPTEPFNRISMYSLKYNLHPIKTLYNNHLRENKNRERIEYRTQGGKEWIKTL